MRKSSHGSASRLAVAEPAVHASDGGGVSLGYQAAGWSSKRGYVYWPTLDPRREIDTYSRTEIARKVHWLCANVGLPRRIIEGLTNLIVGQGLRPQALTKDTVWNELAEKSYNRRANSALAYSVNGRLTAVQSQRLAVKTRLKDGDAAVVFSKSEAGGALRSFYSGVQIANVGNRSYGTNATYDESKWIDGVRLDSLGRAQAYRFPGDNGTFTDVPASDLRLLCRYESPGQLRGISALAHAVNKMIDITEVNSFVMQGIKSSNQIGYYIATEAEENKAKGIAAALGGRTEKVQTDQGPITLKLVYGEGGEIPSLPKGADLKTLLDARPHPNSREFVEDMIRDISWGTGLSSDLLWNIYKLGGANVRYVLADAQVFVGVEQQDLVDTWLAGDWVYHCALEMKAGRLRRCQDPEWWLHGWVPPERVTVDFGRDGRILLEMHKSGLITTERLFAMRGQDAREESSKDLDYVQWYKQEMERRGLTWEDLRNIRGTGSSAGMPVEIDSEDNRQDAKTPGEGEDEEE